MSETQVRIRYDVLGLSALEKANKEMQKSQAVTGDAANGIRKFGGAAQAAGPAVQGLGAAIQSALGPILAIGTAIGVVKKGLDNAFAVGAAEQRLQNFTSSAAEYEAALGVATVASQKFGLAQGETTQALADVYTRLTPLGFGLKEVSDVYVGFNTVAKQSGASAEASAAAFLQLSQALGSGRLQGDEFRSVAEQVPGILKLVADQMGVNVSQLKALSSEGKITSEIIVGALENAANAGGDFTSSLDEATRAQGQLNVVMAKLSTQIGEAFAPAALKIMEGMTWAAQQLSEWWDYIGGVLWPQAMKAIEPVTKELEKIVSSIDWDYLRAAMQSVVINLMEAAFTIVNKVALAYGFLFAKLQEIVASPFGQFVKEVLVKAVELAVFATDNLFKGFEVLGWILEQVAKSPFVQFVKGVLVDAVNMAIGYTKSLAEAWKWVLARVGDFLDSPLVRPLVTALKTILDSLPPINDEVGKFAKQQQDAATAAAETAQNFSGLPPTIVDAKEEAKRLKAEYQAGAAAIKLQYDEMQSLADAEAQRATNAFTLRQSELETQQQLNNLQLQGLEVELEKAKTYGERVRIIDQIYELEKANAALAYESAMEQIANDERLAVLATERNALKLAELEAERALAAAKGQSTAALDLAITKQALAVELAGEQLELTRALGSDQARMAEAVYDSAMQSAELARQTRLADAAAKGMEQTMNGVAAAAGAAASGMERAASAARSVGGISYGTQNLTASEQAEMERRLAAVTGGAPSRIKQRQREDIIAGYQALSSRRGVAEAFRREPDDRYSSLFRSSGGVTLSPQVNIVNSGPVMRFNDTDYVRSEDVPGIVDQAVGQTMGTLQSSNSRYAVGVR